MTEREREKKITQFDLEQMIRYSSILTVIAMQIKTATRYHSLRTYLIGRDAGMCSVLSGAVVGKQAGSHMGGGDVRETGHPRQPPARTTRAFTKQRPLWDTIPDTYLFTRRA